MDTPRKSPAVTEGAGVWTLRNRHPKTPSTSVRSSSSERPGDPAMQLSQGLGEGPGTESS